MAFRCMSSIVADAADPTRLAFHLFSDNISLIEAPKATFMAQHPLISVRIRSDSELGEVTKYRRSIIAKLTDESNYRRFYIARLIQEEGARYFVYLDTDVLVTGNFLETYDAEVLRLVQQGEVLMQWVLSGIGTGQDEFQLQQANAPRCQ